MQTSERTTINMHPERAAPDEREDILNSGLVAHIGFMEDGVPMVIPMTYHYDSERPDIIYIHGGVKSRAMDRMASGIPLCVTVTITDGLVYSRKALNHSVNYRSVMLFGAAGEVTDEGEKYALMDQMVQRYFPDRLVGRDYYEPPSGDLGITTIVEVQIEDWSAKARRGGPTGPDDDDPNALGTAGFTDFREY